MFNVDYLNVEIAPELMMAVSLSLLINDGTQYFNENRLDKESCIALSKITFPGFQIP